MPNTQRGRKPALVLDGHDGAGKSTLAALVAKRIRGRVVKPFSDTLGDHIAWLWGNERFREANSLALSRVEQVLGEAGEEPLVFDRHWATMFSVLPEELWRDWHPIPPTVICTTGPDTTIARLTGRGETPEPRDWHARFTAIYRDLGERHGSLVLDTSDLDAHQAADAVCAHFGAILGGTESTRSEVGHDV